MRKSTKLLTALFIIAACMMMPTSFLTVALAGCTIAFQEAAEVEPASEQPEGPEPEAGQQERVDETTGPDADNRESANPDPETPESDTQEPEADAQGDDEQEPEEDLGPTGYELSEMELMVRVDELVDQIKGQKISERDEAEKLLLHLGPLALDVLEIEDDMTTDCRTRLLRVRVALEKRAAEAVTRESPITIEGKFKLSEIFAMILKQSGNDIGMAGNTPSDFTELELEMAFNKAPFWAVMNEIMMKTGTSIDIYEGDEGELRLALNQDVPEGVDINIPTAQAGVFDVQIVRVDSSRNLAQPQYNYLNLNAVVRWEPRIRPISIQIDASSIEAIDEFGEPMEVSNPDAVFGGIVQQQVPELNFPIPMQLVDRQVEVIQSLTAKIEAVLPGKLETFRFEKAGSLPPGTEKTKAGATVTLQGIRKNEDVYSVTMRIGFDTDQAGMDSYQGWVLDNEMYMIDEQGKRRDFNGLENHSRTENSVGVRYMFIEDPSEWTIVYKTPAAVVKVPVNIELTEIPLP